MSNQVLQNGPQGNLATGMNAQILDALPHPVLILAEDGAINSANMAAEHFFSTSINMMKRRGLDYFLPFGSPVSALISQVQESRVSVNERRIDLSSPRIGVEKQVDVYVSPLPESPNMTLVLLQERSMADKIDRQLSHRGAARTVTGLAAMLAHEIKNPLSGIRGAAQLLESGVENEDDRALSRLIRDETDRIVKLVDRMEVFSDERPPETDPLNIHIALEHVKRLAESGFASHIRIIENYDPSLPMVNGNKDQLIQVFLNLIKNAAEAIGETNDGEIILSTAFRPGVRLSIGSAKERVNLPLEFMITDNGGGISSDLRAHLFDPFVTTKINGSGLGLALVAKVIGDHGGVVECESHGKKTTFRILLPVVGRETNSSSEEG